MKALVRFGLILLATVLAAASLIPLIPTEWWAVRLLDFPRLPFAVGSLIVGLALFPFLEGSPRWTLPALALVTLALTVNAWILWPYRPTGGMRVGACPVERRLSVLIAYVQFGNRNAAPLVEAVAREEPDLFLTMETRRGGTRP